MHGVAGGRQEDDLLRLPLRGVLWDGHVLHPDSLWDHRCALAPALRLRVPRGSRLGRGQGRGISLVDLWGGGGSPGLGRDAHQLLPDQLQDGGRVGPRVVALRDPAPHERHQAPDGVLEKVLLVAGGEGLQHGLGQQGGPDLLRLRRGEQAVPGPVRGQPVVDDDLAPGPLEVKFDHVFPHWIVHRESDAVDGLLRGDQLPKVVPGWHVVLHCGDGHDGRVKGLHEAGRAVHALVLAALRGGAFIGALARRRILERLHCTVRSNALLSLLL
mmetsp:Transcript_116903/g.203455  ORF Transcript_116903/g.203455 Transcript_116903/m.203455 type:complete len:271 (+) Transcript_116903:2669-3481(+)